MVKKSRNLYIDVMKGLLITLVVIGHLPFFDYDSRTLTLIYSFHMPAFLIIGGILSHINEKSSFTDIFIKRIKNILVPYFIFYLISFIIIPINPPENKIQSVITMFKGIGNPDYAINLPLWFLTFYFCALTIFELLECLCYKIKVSLFAKKTQKKNHKIFFVEILAFIAITLIMFLSYWYAKIYHGARLPFNFEISCFCLGFVFFGKLIGLLLSDAIKYIKKNTALTVFLGVTTILFITIFIIFWYSLSMNNGRIDLNARDYKNAFYMYFDALIGFIIFAFFSYIISYIPVVKNIFSFLGENSIFILAYHVPSTIITYNIIIPLFPNSFGIMLSHNSILSIFVLTFLGISISLFFGLIHKLST